MPVVAVLIGIVAAGIVDALTGAARRRRAGGGPLVALALGIAVAIGGWRLVRSIDDELDVYYFVGFLPALLAGDYLSKKVSSALTRRGVRRPR